MTNSAGHKFDSSVLREYDVRGVVGETLHAADANALGKPSAPWYADLAESALPWGVMVV